MSSMSPRAKRAFRSLLVLALSSAALSLAGCSFFKSLLVGDFKKPSLTFQDAGLSEVSLGGATLNLNFKVDNPNGESLSLAETDYKLLVEGKQLVAGKPPGGIKIPANGSALVTLPATVRFADLASSVAAVLHKGAASYRGEGHIGVDTPIGVVALPFSTEGKMELPKVPTVTVGSPALTGISLSGATLKLPLEVTNANAFALPLADVTGALHIAGAEVGNFAAKDLGRLEANAKKIVTLPVTVHFAGAMDAFRALQSGRTEVALSGVLSSGGATIPFHVVQQVDVQQ
jgi:LEA14-like dessication related protein